MLHRYALRTPAGVERVTCSVSSPSPTECPVRPPKLSLTTRVPSAHFNHAAEHCGGAARRLERCDARSRTCNVRSPRPLFRVPTDRPTHRLIGCSSASVVQVRILTRVGGAVQQRSWLRPQPGAHILRLRLLLAGCLGCPQLSAARSPELSSRCVSVRHARVQTKRVPAYCPLKWVKLTVPTQYVSHRPPHPSAPPIKV